MAIKNHNTGKPPSKQTGGQGFKAVQVLVKCLSMAMNDSKWQSMTINDFIASASLKRINLTTFFDDWTKVCVLGPSFANLGLTLW